MWKISLPYQIESQNRASQSCWFICSKQIQMSYRDWSLLTRDEESKPVNKQWNLYCHWARIRPRGIWALCCPEEQNCCTRAGKYEQVCIVYSHISGVEKWAKKPACSHSWLITVCYWVPVLYRGILTLEFSPGGREIRTKQSHQRPFYSTQLERTWLTLQDVLHKRSDHRGRVWVNGHKHTDRTFIWATRVHVQCHQSFPHPKYIIFFSP